MNFQGCHAELVSASILQNECQPARWIPGQARNDTTWAFRVFQRVKIVFFVMSVNEVQEHLVIALSCFQAMQEFLLILILGHATYLEYYF